MNNGYHLGHYWTVWYKEIFKKTIDKMLKVWIVIFPIQTYTIQGTPKDGGILPRALDVVFNSIAKKLYKRPNLKPKHCHDVVRLTMEEEATEEVLRTAIIHAGEKEVRRVCKTLFESQI